MQLTSDSFLITVIHAAVSRILLNSFTSQTCSCTHSCDTTPIISLICDRSRSPRSVCVVVVHVMSTVRRTQMSKVMLTVFKQNEAALEFFTKKLK